MKDLIIILISFVLFSIFGFATIAFSCWFQIKMAKYLEKKLNKEDKI